MRWPTPGPGTAGALLVGAGVAVALAAALGKPVLGIHHLEGHLLSPFLSADPPEFPFVALLVSGGHTQLMRVDGWGATPCWVKPSTMRWVRPSTSQPSCWACLIPAGQACRGWPS